MAPPRTRLLALPSILVLAAACSAPPSGTPASSTSASVSSAASASMTEDPESPMYPVTVVDDAGRELTLEALPERIVSLAPSNTEIVCALGACDRLVGVTDFDDYPAEVAEIDDVVIAATVDVELVVDAEPDLVLAAGNELTPTPVIDQLDELGLPVLVLYPETLEQVYADITLVGEVLGATERAEDVTDDMRERAAAVSTAVDGAERPATLYEVFYAEGSTYTAGEGSFLASMLELAGAEPVTGDAQGLIGTEDLVAADPELILLGTASYDAGLADADAALSAVGARPGWADLAAVRDGAVVPYLDDILTTRPGPRIVDGLEALARAIHPDRFD